MGLHGKTQLICCNGRRTSAVAYGLDTEPGLCQPTHGPTRSAERVVGALDEHPPSARGSPGGLAGKGVRINSFTELPLSRSGTEISPNGYSRLCLCIPFLNSLFSNTWVSLRHRCQFKSVVSRPCEVFCSCRE